MNDINDTDLKQQLDTHLRALVPLEECLKIVPVPPTTEQHAEHRHHHHHHRRTSTITSKSDRLENNQLSEDVIVFTLESSDNECPGMLPEEKVLQENERTKLLKTSSTNEFDPSATEKRLRFRLNDNCSVGNISDNLEGLEGISEGAASTGNLSVTSSCDDLDKATNEIETDALFDNGSVSGRGTIEFHFPKSSFCCFFNSRLATPNLSGRDTPSSHISLDSSDRRTTSTNNPHSHSQDSVINNAAHAGNANQHSHGGGVQRGPVLPIVVQKPFREDVSDKFNLFDLPQQRSTIEGDETRSTISDNWSTMNAGISEIDGQEQAAARLNEIVEELPIIEQRRGNELLLPENHSLVSTFFSSTSPRIVFLLQTLNNINKPLDQQSDCWSTEAFASDSETHSEDGSNLLRLAHNPTTTSTSSINDSSVLSFPIDSHSSSSMDELTKQQKRLTISSASSTK